MDHHKYEAIAHAELNYCSPITDAIVDEIADLMLLEAGDRVIDIGSAKAEILLRMAVTCQVQAFGIDPSPQFMQAAHEAIASRHPAADITLFEQPVSELQITPQSYNAVMCVNSSAFYGSYDEVLRAITPYARADGMVLVGEYYWRKKPSDDVAAALSYAPEAIYDYIGSINAGEAHNLTPVFVATCSQHELDRYEWRRIHAVEIHAMDNPDDLEATAMLQRTRQRRDAYLKYGREYLGFGMFLFKKG